MTEEIAGSATRREKALAAAGLSEEGVPLTAERGAQDDVA
jgi:hypothetical protein